MASETGDLPEFDSDSTYLLKGSTLNSIMTIIKRNTVKPDSGTFKEVGPEGSTVETIDLQVCINGVAQTKTFLIATTESG